jgi:hypothetical protein
VQSRQFAFKKVKKKIECTFGTKEVALKFQSYHAICYGFCFVLFVLLYLLLFFCEPGDLTFTNADTGLKERKKERKKER